MQNSFDMDAVLSKAASSPDPSVRAMALNYRETEEWLKNMNAFFGIWASGGLPPAHIQSSLAPENVSKPAKTPGRPSSSVAAKRPKVVNAGRGAGRPKIDDSVPDEITTNVANVLIEYGFPMKLSPLWEAYTKAHPEKGTTIENFRQQLFNPRRRKFINLTDKGYWPVGADTVQSSDSEAADSDVAA